MEAQDDSTAEVLAWGKSLRSDAELIDALGAQGFKGRGYELFEIALTE